MKNKDIIKAFLIIVLCLCVFKSYAYDFEANGLYYDITSENTVCVTYKNSTPTSYGSTKYATDVEGDITIPRNVIYQGKNYSVTKIGHNAFRDAENLTSVIIPNSVDSIGGTSSFQGCINLKKILIPKTLKFIGACAFDGCGFEEIDLPDSISAITEYMFARCSNMREIKIPENVSEIESYAFLNSGIQNIFLPGNISKIGQNAFMKCSSLESVSIPNSVQSIGRKAFGECGNIKIVISNIRNPFSINENVFEGLTDAILYIPYGTMAEYKKYSGWTKCFKEIRELESDLLKFELSVLSSDHGTVLVDGVAIQNSTKTFDINAGSIISIQIIPDQGYMVKSITQNGNDITNALTDGMIKVKAISSDIKIEVEFVALPPEICILTISAKGSGSITYESNLICDNTVSFSVKRNSSVSLKINIENGYWIKSFKNNAIDVESKIVNNVYTIDNINRDTNIYVEFAEEFDCIFTEKATYRVSSYKDKALTIKRCEPERVLIIPAQIEYEDISWNVSGIDNDALKDNKELAAIIWNPSALFNASVDNPNVLLYVTSADYAPTEIANVVVNGNAEKIILKDATNGNDFYCPKEFTAKTISYTHNYGMTTGYGEAKGWESIVLPFDVQKVEHPSKGELIAYSNWKSGDAKKPFWLMEYGTGGWTHANKIKANTPYIISMPNHTNYKPEFRMNGSITFSADNVKVKASDNMQSVNQGGKAFVPNYSNKTNESIYSLNTNSDYTSYYGEYTEGSRFVLNLRPVHPFEAYMTSISNATRSIAISDDMTTGLDNLIETDWNQGDGKIYNLQGQMIKTEKGKSIDEALKELPAGMYIVNGKKLIIK